MQWNLSFPTTCGTRVWICSILQTHEIVYRLWNPFYQSPVNPQSKIFLYSLKLKFFPGACTLRKEANRATTFHRWVSSRLGKFLNWLVSQKPLHQLHWVASEWRLWCMEAARVFTERNRSQPRPPPSVMPHWGQAPCTRGHFVLFICFSPTGPRTH